MSAHRQRWTAAELAALGPSPLVWPAFSIAFLCVFTLFAPPGFISGMNVYLLLLVAICWLASRAPIEAALLCAVVPFVAAIAVGLVGGVGNDRYLYFKDAWYYANPAIVIAVGYVLARLLDDMKRGLRAFVIGGTLVSLFHLAVFAWHPELFNAAATRVREMAGTGYYVTALVVVMLVGWMGRWRSDLGLHPCLGGVCLALCTASFALSFSRTMTMVVAIGLLGMAGFFARREWLRIGLLAVVVALSLGLLEATVDTASAQARRSFVGKLARSAQEVRVEDYTTAKAINDNWRGFETSRAMATWKSGNVFEMAFGHGFGAQVDLGLFQNLSNDARQAVRFIPIFHNGYMYLLVKTGIVGVALYLAALLSMYLIGRRAAAGPPGQPRTLQGRALQSAVMALAVTTWVVSGAFNKFDMFAVLMFMGFMLAMLAPRVAALP